MGGKLKFKPIITKIKLNPEQAVLTCSCWSKGRIGTWSSTRTGTRTAVSICLSNARTTTRYSRTATSLTSS